MKISSLLLRVKADWPPVRDLAILLCDPI